jgi:hypothetical protein
MIVWFLGKDSYQGMPSGVPILVRSEPGFSRWAFVGEWECGRQDSPIGRVATKIKAARTKSPGRIYAAGRRTPN